jgi:hypothetical protein
MGNVTPEREFSNFVLEEAKRRGLGVFVCVVNEQTEQIAYDMRIETGNKMAAAFFQWLQDNLSKVTRKPNG